MRVVCLGLLIWLVAPPSAEAWGFSAHRFIMSEAIDRLPEDLRRFFETRRVFLTEHSIDPDLWRTAGFEDESPRHFLDLDAYGEYPFAALPQGYEAAVAKFGSSHVQRNGTLPWRAAEMHEKLADAFRRLGTSRPGYARDDVMFFAAVISHYLADGYVPFHAVRNYDGQLTNQRGIHARFETALFERFRERLRIEPPVRAPIAAPIPLLFDVLREGTRLVPRVLQADLEALAGRRLYDDRYFERFFERTRVVLEARLGEAIGGVASAIVGAWEQGGRPDLGAGQP